MAVFDYFVGDGGADTNGVGDGESHANRWLTIQYALDNMNQSNLPIRLNIRGLTTAQGAWDFTSHGSGSWVGTIDDDNFMVIQGYDTTPEDGTIASIDGNGSQIINLNTLDYLTIKDLSFTNWGSSWAFDLDDFCAFENVELDGEGARSQGITIRQQGLISNCNIHSMAHSTGDVVYFQQGQCAMHGTYIQCDSSSGSGDMVQSNDACVFMHNTFSSTTTNDVASIKVTNRTTNIIINNSFINQSAGVGQAIDVAGASNKVHVIKNNLFDGWSGIGGFGIRVTSGANLREYGYNSFFECDTNEDVGDVSTNLGNDDDLGSSPFEKNGDDTYANRNSYYAPVNIGNIRMGAHPTGLRHDRGAVQHAAVIPIITPNRRPI